MSLSHVETPSLCTRCTISPTPKYSTQAYFLINLFTYSKTLLQWSMVYCIVHIWTSQPAKLMPLHLGSLQFRLLSRTYSIEGKIITLVLYCMAFRKQWWKMNVDVIAIWGKIYFLLFWLHCHYSSKNLCSITNEWLLRNALIKFCWHLILQWNTYVTKSESLQIIMQLLPLQRDNVVKTKGQIGRASCRERV